MLKPQSVGQREGDAEKEEKRKETFLFSCSTSFSLLHSSPPPFFSHLCLLDACPSSSVPSSHPSTPRPFISRCQSSLHKHPSDVETSWCPSFSYNTRCSPKASRVLV
ncbi:hypothetical protein E2C01_002855 [Portunus trituberculatus]|uniref:Uncharacterized protein n=1 Tax=Portunus trituberculatus TaxID=210409 RepID=A0A5B7CRT4_PORTR|nr:hypothetical protein [Portunus trituberculatus]